MDAPRVVFVTDLAVVPEAELHRRLGAARSLAPALRGRLAIQLREPALAGGAKAALGARLREATAALGAQLIVNDRLDLAVALGADGVHLGRRSVTVRDARALVGLVCLTRAAHAVDDVVAALDAGADGALLSPIFASPGKGTPLGLAALEAARAAVAVRGHPRFLLYALGGVDATNALACLDAGATGVAVVRADLGSTLAACLAR